MRYSMKVKNKNNFCSSKCRSKFMNVKLLDLKLNSNVIYLYRTIKILIIEFDDNFELSK